MQKQVYSIDEAAKILEVHPDTIRRMIKREEVQFTRVGKQYRIPQSEIDRLSGGNAEQRTEENQ